MSGHQKQWNAGELYPYHSKDENGEYFALSARVIRPGTVDDGRRIVTRLTRRNAEALRDSLIKMLEVGQ